MVALNKVGVEVLGGIALSCIFMIEYFVHIHDDG